jgi:tetratricopeptide (TPR) repeat protein
LTSCVPHRGSCGILAAVGADEEGTHERLKAHRRDLVDPKIKEHQGRIVKTTSDGMLVEFASVVDAVRCATEMQRGMIDREPEGSDERRIRFRIGINLGDVIINLGDVIVEGGDIFGDGVNVAARLEALAEPGGICISRTVREQIRDKPRDPLAHSAKGEVLRAQNRFHEAMIEYETIIGLDRNRVQAYANLGQCKFYQGYIEEYIPLVERALRLSPRDHRIGVWFGGIGLVHLLQSRIIEAIHWLEKARNANPTLPYVRSRLAAAYALNGEIERAAVELAEARNLSGDDRHSSIARFLKTTEAWGVPKIRALQGGHLFRWSAQGRDAGGMNAARITLTRC